MMVNCPKCGFSQPEDQYCAKCGVDMVAFKARARASRSIFVNPAVQIGGLAVVLIGAFAFVHSSNKMRAEKLAADTVVVRDIDQQESELAQAQTEQRSARLAMNETSSASVGSPVSEAKSLAAQPAGGSAPISAERPANEPAQAPMAQTSAAKAVAPAAGIRAALQPAQNVRVYFIEAQAAFLDHLMSDAHDGDGSFGVVSNLDQQLRQSREWHSLDTTSDQLMKVNQPNVFTKGMVDRASNQNVGLNVQVIPLAKDEAGTRLQIDANRTLRDPTTGIDLVSFPTAEILVPKGSSVVMRGVLPQHRQLGPEELTLYRSVNVLKPMTTDQFRNGATDVAIIIQAH